jgi:hypothetical protein
MDAYKDDIIDDLTTTAVDVTGYKIYNHKKHLFANKRQCRFNRKDWEICGSSKQYSQTHLGVDIMENDWSIVKVQHDIIKCQYSSMFFIPQRSI